MTYDRRILAPPSLSEPPVLSERLMEFLSLVTLGRDEESCAAGPRGAAERHDAAAAQTEQTVPSEADDVDAFLSSARPLRPHLLKARKRAELFERDDLRPSDPPLSCPRCGTHVHTHPIRAHAWLCLVCRHELGEAAWIPVHEDEENDGYPTVTGELPRARGGGYARGTAETTAILTAAYHDDDEMAADLDRLANRGENGGLLLAGYISRGVRVPTSPAATRRSRRVTRRRARRSGIGAAAQETAEQQKDTQGGTQQ